MLATRPPVCLIPCKGSGGFKSLRPLEHRSYNVNLNNLKIAARLFYPPPGGVLVSLQTLAALENCPEKNVCSVGNHVSSE